MNAATFSAPASRRFLGWLAAALLLAGLAFRLPALNSSLWVDEVGSLTQASAANFWSNARLDVHPPLYYLLLRGELLFTSSVPLLRLLSVACGLALAGAAVWSCRLPPAGAVTVGVLAAFSAGLLPHSVQLRPYALLYLLLGVAVLLTVRLASGNATFAVRVALAGVLAAAATTHLTVVFFLAALAPFLIWSVRRQGLAAQAVSCWPLLPALLLLLWFKFFFVTQPYNLPEGWWVPALRASAVLADFRDATGWENLRWLAEAVTRWTPLPAGAILGGASGLALIAVSGALRPVTDPVSWLLLAAAFTYWLLLIAYSVLFEPIVLARTLLPGFLFFFAWLAWGIGHQPHPHWRRAASLAVVGYTTLTLALPVRQMQHPAPGLRDLAGALDAQYRSGDLIVTLRGLDVGVIHYWSPPTGDPWLRLDLARPLSAQLEGVEARLRTAPPGARVWLVYRDDLYFQRDQAAFSAFTAAITRHGGAFRTEWQGADLVLQLADLIAVSP